MRGLGIERHPHLGVSWVTPGNLKSDRYLRAVEMAGGKAVPLVADAQSWSAHLQTIHGLLLTGGGDVDPALYGEENLASHGIIRHRDDLELEALRYCMDRGLPVLAICRGLQFVNAALGGSLIQDIKSDILHRSENDQSSFHDIEVLPESLLWSIAGQQRRVRVNSRHHQGVDLPRVAPHMRVTAVASDGIVEAMELEDEMFLVAVQCHPEYLDQVAQLSGLFTAFVAKARK